MTKRDYKLRSLAYRYGDLGNCNLQPANPVKKTREGLDQNEMEFGEFCDADIRKIKCTHNLQGVPQQTGALFLTNYKLIFKPFALSGIEISQTLKEFFCVPHGLIFEVRDR